MNIINFFNKKKYLYIALFVFTFVILGITFIFIFQLPYTGDDRMNSLAKGVVMTSDQNVWHHSYGIQKLWTDKGRFFPFGYYSFPIFYFLPDLLSYRIFQFLLNYIVIIIFAYVVYQITKKWELSFFSVLMVSVFFQIRNYHDAITGYHGLLQFVMLFFLLAILFQAKAVERRFVPYTILSGFFYLCSLLLYEVAFSFIAIFILFSFLSYRQWKKRIVGVYAHLTAIILVMIPTIYYKLNATENAYEGITPSIDFRNIIRTFAVQFSAAIPLSSQQSTWGDIFQTLFQQIKSMSVLKLFCIIAFLIAMIGIFSYSIYQNKPVKTEKATISDSSEKNQDHSALRTLFFIGCSLMIFPAGLLSLSSRYQEELTWGLGYLPVYIQYFGGICVTGSVVFILIKKIKKRSMQVLLSGIITLAFCALFISVQALNITARDDIIHNDLQAVSHYAIESGILNELEDDAQFFVLQGGLAPEMYPEHFVIQYADGLKIQWSMQAELLSKKNAQKIENDQVTIFPENLYIFYVFGSIENGIAILAKAEKIVFDLDEKTFFKDSIREVYFTQGKGVYFGNEKDKLFLQAENSDITENLEYSVESLFNEEAGVEQVISKTPTNIRVKRISDVFCPSSFDMHFTPRKERSFQFQLFAENGQIRLRGMKI